jgi:hypothetical protein
MVELDFGRLWRMIACCLQVLILQLVFTGSLIACPTCKDGLHADGTAAAYAMSILFMMGMPFVILSCWVTTIVRLRHHVGDIEYPSLDESTNKETAR